MRFDLAAASRCSPPRNCTCARSSTSCCGSFAANTNIRYLKDNGVSIWDEWADADGELGPVYGYQWRSWPAADGRHIDQIAQVLEQIRGQPRLAAALIVSAWNVADVERMALAPCHALFQFYVQDGRLSCQLYQRSADVFPRRGRSTSPPTRCSR